MTRSIDPRRPRTLTAEQLRDVKHHPEVKLFSRRCHSMKKKIRAQYKTISNSRGKIVYQNYQDFRRKLRQKTRAVGRSVLAQVKAAYQRQQPIAEIERQLNAGQAAEVPKTDSVPLIDERMNAIAALFSFATDDVEEECRRRAAAIVAVTTLSRRQEPLIRKVCIGKRTYTPMEGMPAKTTTEQDFPICCSPTQCIFCIGQTKLSTERRLKQFHSPSDLKKHFKRKHLDHHPDGTPIDCPHPKCKIALQGKAHLQNHAATVHGTPT